MEVTLQEMLLAREQRAQRQMALRPLGQTMISFTMNIAGPIKNSPLISGGYGLGTRLLKGLLAVNGIRISHSEEVRENTGNELLLLVDAEPLTVKAITAELEDASDLGRLFDMDVLRPDGRKVDRQELGLPGRRCLLCGESAQVCARSRRHSVAELQAKTREILRHAVDASDSSDAARLACQALLYEVAVTPKPGLVDRENSGSHRDMDFFTFQASAAALHPYFAQCTRIGRQGGSPEETLARLRLPGKIAEGEMRRATGNVNTHKGAIFSMGILCAALGRLDRAQWRNPQRVLAECAAMAKGIVSRDYENLTAENAVTPGQRFYLQYGITGVRGQAEAGFPAVLEAGLPTLEAALAAGKDINEAGCAALLTMLTHTADTSLLHRGGYDGMQHSVEAVRQLLERERFPSREALEDLDRRFQSQNLSPGGTADLLAMTFFLHFLKEDL